MRPPGLQSVMERVRSPLKQWQVPKPGPRPRLDFTAVPADALMVNSAHAANAAGAITLVAIAYWMIRLLPFALP